MARGKAVVLHPADAVSPRKGRRRYADRLRVLFESLEIRQLLATTWYVATNGSDSNPGSLASPFLTLNGALTAAVAGDTIDLRAGKYAGHVLISTNNLTIQSYPGELATIDTPQNNINLPWTLDYDVHVVGGTLQNLDISGGYSYALKFESNHDDDNPQGTYFGASGITVQNCIIHDSGQHVVKISPECDNLTIRSNEIYNSGMRDPNNGQGIDAVNTDNILIENNYVHDCTQNGIYIKGGSRNGVIQNNRVENVGFSGILLGQQTDYGFFSTTDNPNLFESFDSVARNNIVINADQSGIGVWGSYDATVTNNIIINSATDGQAGILVNDSEHFIPPTYVENDRSCVGVTITNNVVVQTDVHPIFQIRDHGMDPGLFPTMSGNHYYQTNGLAQFWDERTVFKGTLTQWQTYSGTDSDAVESNPGLMTAAAPAEVWTTSTPSQINLSWLDTNDTVAPGSANHTYYIYRGEKPNFSITPQNRIAITTTPSYTDSTIQPGALYYYRITIDNGSGTQSLPSANGRAAIPAAGQMDFVNGLPTLTMTFDENVGGSIHASDLLLMNLQTGQPVFADSASFDSTTYTATFHIPQTLADGTWSASLVPGSVIDGDGDPISDAFSFNFLTVSGDDATNDTITISSDGQSVQAFKNVPTTGTPSFTAPLANLAFVTLQGEGGDDIFNFNGPITGPRTYFNGGIGQTLLNVNSGTCTLQEDASVGNDNLAINVATGAVLNFNTTTHLTNLTIAGRASMATNGNNVLVTKGISFSGTGKLNMHDNDLIYDYSNMGPMSSWNGTGYTGVVGMVASGRNGGSWNGPGIYSTSATTANSYQTLGAAESSNAFGLSGNQTKLFDGQTVDATSIVVKYTYGGDTNLDGVVNVDDYIRLDSSAPLGLNGWANGDFNYDGKINIDDYTISDFSLGTQAGPL